MGKLSVNEYCCVFECPLAIGVSSVAPADIEETSDDAGPLIELFVLCDCCSEATLSLLISGFAEQYDPLPEALICDIELSSCVSCRKFEPLVSVIGLPEAGYPAEYTSLVGFGGNERSGY